MAAAGGRSRRIAFYAPMKSPNHPVPSGDRQMARNLMDALRRAGHEVSLISELRTYLKDPDDGATHAAQMAAADAERGRIAADWAADLARGASLPDLWITYHPYYKSPDLIGPPLCAPRGVPWVTIEASQSKRRSVGHWTDYQARALAQLRAARVNIALTERDRKGLLEVDPSLTVVRLPPFIEAAPLLALPAGRGRGPDTVRQMVCVAMMREGDKLESYAILAAALRLLRAGGWHLTIVGDGPAEARVRALFAGLEAEITWAGSQDAAGVQKILGRSDLFVWPGCGEAFGLAYLEAQAAGLAVAAQAVAGVPEVVAQDRGGLLSPAGDVAAYAAVIDRLLSDPGLRRRLGQGARQSVMARHDLPAAAAQLGTILDRFVWTG